LLSLIGDIALTGGPQVHAHVVPGLSYATSRGGHLLAAEVCRR
jgi:predicted DNA-binding protein with PD1-like motif